MKTCGFENQINLYLDGELSGAKLRSFEAHMQECPQCREEVEQYRGMLDGLRSLEEREVPPMLQDRLHAALANEAKKGDGRVKRKINPWALTAAAVLVVCLVSGTILVGSGGLFLTHSNSSPGGFTAAREQDKGFAGTGSSNDGSVAQATEAPVSSDYAPVPAPTAAAATLASSSGMDMRNAVTQKNLSAVAPSEPNATAADFNSLTKAGDDGRKIIYTASLVVETREYGKCMDTIKGVLAKYGGYKESSQENGVPDSSGSAMGRTAVISVRIPINQYDAAMGDLQAMGNILSKNESTEDVSRQYVDTEARNKTMIMQRDKLYDLLAKADTMDNIIALQNEITRLTVEIEQMTAQLKFWDDKVSYSTITVELHELVTPKSVNPMDPDLNTRMNGALNSTLNGMKKGFEDFSVNFVGFLPWLAIIVVVAGVLAAVIVPVARKARRNSDNKRIQDKKKEE